MNGKTRAAWFIAAVMIAHVPAWAGTITLPAGTTLHVVLETTLSTKDTKEGDPFRARMVMPIFLNEREVLPMGTAVEGSVVNVQAPGRVKGKAEMQLRPERLMLPDGRDVTLAASIEGAKTDDGTTIEDKEGTVKAGGKEGIDKKKAAMGAVMGTAAGAGMGGGTGAIIGAGAAGAAILLQQIFKKGKDAVLPAGTELVLELTREASFSDMQEVRKPVSQPHRIYDPAVR